MSYVRFGLMILTSTVVMFVLMYLNTYAGEHIFFSETRVYMATMMGATMAVVMLAFMAGMYPSRAANVAIFAAAAAGFALSLWLVRSQATVSGTSYMRAMIPHHSIAVMTSERADIDDARVRKLADEIIAAQRREIAEMRYLIARTAAGETVADVHEDPAPQPGTVADARANIQLSSLDPAPTPRSLADLLLPPGERCAFRRSRGSNPVLWVDRDGGAAAMALNGVLVALTAEDEWAGGLAPDGAAAFAAPGTRVTVRALGEEGDWRQDADLVFTLENGPRIGYRGFWRCEG